MEKHNNKKAVSYNRWGYLFCCRFLSPCGFFQLIPLATTIYNGFFENYRSGLSQIAPNFVGMQNFVKLISDGELLVYLQNTMIMWIMDLFPRSWWRFF